MDIEVIVNVIKEVSGTAITKTSKLRREELKLAGKPTTCIECQRHWMDPLK